VLYTKLELVFYTRFLFYFATHNFVGMHDYECAWKFSRRCGRRRVSSRCDGRIAEIGCKLSSRVTVNLHLTPLICRPISPVVTGLFRLKSGGWNEILENMIQ